MSKNLRAYTIEEIKEQKLWLIYDKVYDLREFLRLHPGGAKIVAKFAGTDCTDAFAQFHKPEAVLRLVGEEYVVGILSGPTGPRAGPELSASEILQKIPEESRTPGLQTPSKRQKVAIIGGGIAGVGCAWALHRDGNFEVSLYEREAAIGGNATTFHWPKTPDGKRFASGVSVLAWPKAYFRNYEAVLNEVGIKSSSHPIRFFLAAHASLFKGKLQVEPGSLVADAEVMRKSLDRINRVQAQLNGQTPINGSTSSNSGLKSVVNGQGDLLFFANDRDSALRRFFQPDLGRCLV
jgi:hypothetical protein